MILTVVGNIRWINELYLYYIISRFQVSRFQNADLTNLET
jgi:hypothetical protein